MLDAFGTVCFNSSNGGNFRLLRCRTRIGIGRNPSDQCRRNKTYPHLISVLPSTLGEIGVIFDL
jgi:hypothetical protein